MPNSNFNTAIKDDITVYGGATISFPIEFTDDVTGLPIVLTGNTYLMEVKDTSTAFPYTTKLTFTTSDPTITIGGTEHNVLTFYKQNSIKGGLYQYDLFQTGTTGLVEPIMYGKFTIIQRITNSELDT